MTLWAARFAAFPDGAGKEPVESLGRRDILRLEVDVLSGASSEHVDCVETDSRLICTCPGDGISGVCPRVSILAVGSTGERLGHVGDHSGSSLSRSCIMISKELDLTFAEETYRR